MVVYYAREKGWTTDDYAKAREWHRAGLTVITYRDGRRYNWRTGTFEQGRENAECCA